MGSRNLIANDSTACKHATPLDGSPSLHQSRDSLIAREIERRAVPIVCVKSCAYNTE